MSGVRLLVEGSNRSTQGTAFFVRPGVVCTACHVAFGGEIPRAEPLPNFNRTLHLRDQTGTPWAVGLTLACIDPQSDIALLTGEIPPIEISVLPFFEGVLTPGTKYSADGFPTFHGGKPFTVVGEIAAVRPTEKQQALQLLVAQGTQASWGGMSGAPVLCNGAVAGVVTQATQGTSTGWAAHLDAIKNLLWAFDIRKVLFTHYTDVESLLAFERDLGWEQEPATDREVVIQRILLRMITGAPAARFQVFTEIEKDLPQLAELADLRNVLLQRSAVPSAHRPVRPAPVSAVLQSINVENRPGVALLEPFGFAARRVVDAALEAVRTENLALWPLRLVPPRHTQSPERLYRSLSRDLKSGLEELVGRPLPESWAEPFNQPADFPPDERFEYTLEGLLEGPVSDSKREVLLIVEDLARVSDDILEQWGYLMARLSRKGLKLLVWGGQELSDLQTRPPKGNAASAFHHLASVKLGLWDEAHIKDLLTIEKGPAARQLASRVLAVTNGHPALVEELVTLPANELASRDQASLMAELIEGPHLTRLTRALEADPAARAILIDYSRNSLKTLPRLQRKEEERLRWLGILMLSGPKEWVWAAPLFAQWAASLSQRVS